MQTNKKILLLLVFWFFLRVLMSPLHKCPAGRLPILRNRPCLCDIYILCLYLLSEKYEAISAQKKTLYM